MKKEYSKPEIFIESYQLIQSIAESCGSDPAGTGTLGRPTHADPNSCSWDLGNIQMWIENNSKCNRHVPVDTEVGGGCYNNPQGMPKLFAS